MVRGGVAGDAGCSALGAWQLPPSYSCRGLLVALAAQGLQEMQSGSELSVPPILVSGSLWAHSAPEA